MKRLTVVFLIIALLLSVSCAKETENEKTTDYSINNTQSKTEYIRAVWLTYSEIADLSKGKTEKEFREKIINLAAELKAFGINTLAVHAVAFCDSFYKSRILPASQRLDKNIDYDIFKIITDLCTQAGIDIQAWINPYRVSNSGDMKAVNENTLVNRLYSESHENLIINENEIYLNPAASSVQKLVLDEARELLENYLISAIHIDDYFYPDMSSFADKKSYEEYKKNGGSLSVENWRRENVNTLICSLHSLTASHGKALAISPAADIEKNNNLKFADISLWLEKGWADIIIPQIYFGFENESKPFEKTLNEWTQVTENKPTKLVIGLAAYKCGEKDLNAGSGKNEWIEHEDIISRQISLILSKNTIYGVAFFSYSYIFDKNTEKFTKKELQNIKSML